MAINFDAVVRLTEALLPLLRAGAPSAIVNVSSTSGRVARGGSGAYSASKFALAGWSDSLYAEKAHGVHVGLVLPGFISTEGFPQRELTGKALTRWAVSTPEKGAEAIVAAGLGRRPALRPARVRDRRGAAGGRAAARAAGDVGRLRVRDDDEDRQRLTHRTERCIRADRGERARRWGMPRAR